MKFDEHEKNHIIQLITDMWETEGEAGVDKFLQALKNEVWQIHLERLHEQQIDEEKALQDLDPLEDALSVREDMLDMRENTLDARERNLKAAEDDLKRSEAEIRQQYSNDLDEIMMRSERLDEQLNERANELRIQKEANEKEKQYLNKQKEVNREEYERLSKWNDLLNDRESVLNQLFDHIQTWVDEGPQKY